MALKKITDLQLASVMTDTMNIPADDGIQTYRVTGAQIKAWLLGVGSITRSMLTAAERLPVGTVLLTAGSAVDTGFLYCDGSAISRTTYADLFAKIGTNFGVGDGSTTFNIPNTAGLFPKFAGSQTVSGRSFSGTYATRGRDSTALPGTAFTTGVESATHTHTYGQYTIPSGSTAVNNGGNPGANVSTNTGTQSANHTHTITGGGDALTQPGHIVFNAQIKY